MKVLIAAGGTAGHINPALAIARGIETRWPGSEIHFAGRKNGMEARLVQKAGYPFHIIEVEGFQRKLSGRNIKRNLYAASLLLSAPGTARKMLADLPPDIVIGTGGFVSGPVLKVAASKGYKTAIHEQNAYPGVTNRLLAKKADLIFAPSECAVARLGYPQKTIVTGNPVRPELFEQNREEERKKIEVADRVVLVSFGGSNGARRVNEVIAQLAQWHTKNKNFLHIHATGRIEKENFEKLAKELGIENSPNFVIKEYIDNMPALLAAADLVIGRAGASTLAELAAVGRASVLIPSPNVAENHQYYNAMEFENAGAANVIEEKNLSGELLIKTVDALTAKTQQLVQMGENAKKLAKPKALEDIVEAIAKLLNKE
ncbi:MAG: undecaprenyldiphospho-muramoylpentapeptide beta-N-acetylglucosaminyltransferase [Oscillospiraceae bacterium]